MFEQASEVTLPLQLRGAEGTRVHGATLLDERSVPAVVVVVLAPWLNQVDVDLVVLGDIPHALDAQDAVALLIPDIEDAPLGVVFVNPSVLDHFTPFPLDMNR